MIYHSKFRGFGHSEHIEVSTFFLMLFQFNDIINDKCLRF